MGVQEHHGRGAVIERVEFVDIVDLTDVLADELLPPLLPAAAGKPHGLGDDLAEMVIELPVDVLDDAVVQVGEAAGYVREGHIATVMEHIPHEPGDEPTQAVVIPQRQTGMQAEEKLRHAHAE